MITQDQYDHIKSNGFNPGICRDCQEIALVFGDLITQHNLYEAAPAMYEALKAMSDPSSPTSPKQAHEMAEKALAKAEEKVQ